MAGIRGRYMLGPSREPSCTRLVEFACAWKSDGFRTLPGVRPRNSAARPGDFRSPAASHLLRHAKAVPSEPSPLASSTQQEVPLKGNP